MSDVSGWLIFAMAFSGSVFLVLLLALIALIIATPINHFKYVKPIQSFLYFIINKDLETVVVNYERDDRGLPRKFPTILEHAERTFGKGEGQVDKFEEVLAICTDYAHGKQM